MLFRSQTADFEMAMYNADGSRGEMCGNGIRCVGKYVYDYGLTNKTNVKIETLAGTKDLDLTVENGKVSTVTVNMGAPELSPEKIPVDAQGTQAVNIPLEVGGRTYQMTCISMGNPHCVIFMEKDVRELDLEKIGPSFERHPRFPKRINTEFVNVLGRDTLRMRVWERGSGETLACGTGACATAAAAVLNGKTGKEVTVQLLGGSLSIRWEGGDAPIYMTGPAATVFDGEVFLPPELMA